MEDAVNVYKLTDMLVEYMRVKPRSFPVLQRRSSSLIILATLSATLLATPLESQTNSPYPTVEVALDGQLVYTLSARGDRIPDFSYCGYFGGNKQIPNTIPIKVVVTPVDGDNTPRLQQAINYVGSLPVDSNGFRGCILLTPGRFLLKGRLTITNSGVVLRGSGMKTNGTVLLFAGSDRGPAIRLYGARPAAIETNVNWRVTNDYVPVGAMTFGVLDTTGLHPGDRIFITRPSTSNWIRFLKMHELGGGLGGWNPGSRNVTWDRAIVAISNNQVWIDAPLTLAIEQQFGQATIKRYLWPGRLTNCGVENLVIQSSYDHTNPKDEDHIWHGVTFENAADCWVRRLCFTHLAGSAVAVYETASRITVQDCISEAPVSEDGGYRRNTYFTMGQQTLFLRCYAEYGRHDFAAGYCAAGPNAFVCCEATLSTRPSGGIESLACGILFDNVTVDGNGIFLANLGGTGGRFGWGAVNSVLWQCSASIVRCDQPPGAFNWAFGCWGEFDGDGYWRASNESVEPESLYIAQLSERLGKENAGQIILPPKPRGGESNPTLERAQQLTQESIHPSQSLKTFILELTSKEPLPLNPNGAPSIDHIGNTTTQFTPTKQRNLTITNGWLVIEDRLAIGTIISVAWWRGTVNPEIAPTHGVALTRFMPGRIGRGFTDDLNEVADYLEQEGAVGLEHNHGLWYDRRRDDHERVRRATSDVLPPFFEQPFARSGVGTAWDGLSKYDLTRYNPFYWARLAQFATICDQRGLILFHHHYFQHNILEAGAHWADFPWRSANNINNTGFPEPPYYAGGKRIFMAEQFYNTNHPTRHPLHVAYINQCLNALATNKNVIHFIAAEYTGPLHFVQFWIDVIKSWQNTTGIDPIVALSCTKDVQEAILEDPLRSKYIDVVDFRYWWRTEKGEFAPPGGKNLAPRQFERQWRGSRPTDIDLAQMAAEFKARYPEKALICAFNSAGWAWLCAGGSIPRLPKQTDESLLKFVPTCAPAKHVALPPRTFALKNTNDEWLIYCSQSGPITLPVGSSNNTTFRVRRLNITTGQITTDHPAFPTNNVLMLNPESVPAVYWIIKPR